MCQRFQQRLEREVRQWEGREKQQGQCLGVWGFDMDKVYPKRRRI